MIAPLEHLPMARIEASSGTRFLPEEPPYQRATDRKG